MRAPHRSVAALWARDDDLQDRGRRARRDGSAGDRRRSAFLAPLPHSTAARDARYCDARRGATACHALRRNLGDRRTGIDAHRARALIRKVTMKNVLFFLALAAALAGCGDNKPLSPKVEPAGMSSSTAPPAAAPPVAPTTAPALPPSPPTSAVPAEPAKSPPGPAAMTPETAKESTAKNVEQAKDAAAKAVDAAKDAAKK